MARIIVFLLVWLGLAGAATAQTAAPKRVALVIANSGYTSIAHGSEVGSKDQGLLIEFANIPRDAALMAASFKAADFDVTEVRDATAANMAAAFTAFREKARQADAAVVYYTGVGVELSGVNYLAGTEARMQTASDVTLQGGFLPLSTAVQSVQQARQFSMVMIDSGRIDPFVATRGFSIAKTSQVARDSDVLIFYGSQLGRGSEDGPPGANGPFAAALAKHMATPGLEIGLFVRRVRADVMRSSASEQRPELAGELGEREFYFRPGAAVPTAAPAATPVFSNQPRIALIIGNSDYNRDGDLGDDRNSVPVQEHGFAADLPNPVNDAADMAAALKRLKFDVSLVENADYGTMLETLFAFEKKIEEAGEDALVVIYYAGHAIQVGGANYLIPAGAKMPNMDMKRLPPAQAELILQQFALPVQTSLIDRLKNPSERGLNVIILDACREDPWAPSGASRSVGRGSGATRGLGEVRIDLTRTALAFATKPGDVAADGNGRNSPYTAALKDVIELPGISAMEMLDRVGAKVQTDTGKRQVPWFNVTSIGRTCLGSCLTAQ